MTLSACKKFLVLQKSHLLSLISMCGLGRLIWDDTLCTCIMHSFPTVLLNYFRLGVQLYIKWSCIIMYLCSMLGILNSSSLWYILDVLFCLISYSIDNFYCYKSFMFYWNVYFNTYSMFHFHWIRHNHSTVFFYVLQHKYKIIYFLESLK